MRMMLRRRCRDLVPFLWILCSLAFLAPTDGAAAPGSGASTIPLGGVNIAGPSNSGSGARADQEIAGAHALHAKIVRTEVLWSDLQPVGPGQIDAKVLAYLDRLVADAATDGIRVIILVDGTPCWASSAPLALSRKCVPGRPSKASSWPPRQPADFASFAGYLAHRYGTRLAAFEVWNEPDQANEAYFAGPHKAQRYAALLRAAYPAIKQADPALPVLGGSLVGSNGVFLRALYAAGIKGYYDGLAVHFYNLTLGSVRSIHEVQLVNGDRTPLWLDEFGWSSCWPRERIQQEQACVTAQIQAANFVDVFHALANTSYIAAEVIFKLQDSPGENFGTVTTRGVRKPSFRALAQVLASPFGSEQPVTLSLSRRRGAIVARGSAPVGDFMELEAFHEGVLRYRAVFTLDRFNRYSITMPRVLGTHGMKVRVYQYWEGPSKAAQKQL